jgi:hypothetical protein
MSEQEKNDRGLKDMFKQVYDVWEKSATEQLEKFTRSQAFLTALAQNVEQTLNVSQRVKDITQTTLGMMNLPTRQDIEQISKQLRALRNVVAEINEKLDEMGAKPVPAKTKATGKKSAKTSKRKASS